MATAGSIVIDLLMKTGAFETDSKRAEKRLREMQKAAKQFGVAVGAAIVTAGTALTAVTIKAIQFADEIDHLSTQMGVSTEALSGWAYATGQAGTSFDALTRGIPRLSKAMADAQDEGSRLNNLFKALGVDTVDPLTGSLRSVEDVLPELADRFKGITSETTKSALAMELFGRSGAEMAEFLSLGSEGIKELTDRAAQLGVVIGDETAANAAEFNDRLDDLKQIAMAIGLQMADRLLPAMNELVEYLGDAAREGDLAANMADGLEEKLRSLADVAVILSSTVKGVTFDLIALYKVASAASQFSIGGIFDDRTMSGLMDEAATAREMAAEQSAIIEGILSGRTGALAAMSRGARGTAPARTGIPMGDGQSELIRADPIEMALAEYLRDPTATGTGGGKKGLSDAEKEAQQLQRAYDSLIESLDRQQFMLGKVGEEAQVRYEIEMGSLKELAPELQNELLAKAALLDAEVAAREEAQKQAELDRQATEAFDRMNGQILEQIELIGMSADEQEVYLNLAWAGVEAESERGKVIAENTRLLQEQREAMSEQIEAMDAVRDAGREFLGDLFDGSKSFKDAFLDALDSIQQRLLQMIADNLIEQLLGKDGDPGGGAGGDWLGALFGSFFGGAKAGGGDVFANRPLLIGEQGPEMFIPRSAGSIIPAEQVSRMAGGGGKTVVQNIAFQLPGRYDQRTQAQIAADAGRASQRAISRSTA